MSDTPPDSLQFDNAEFATQALTPSSCAVCQGGISDEYYEVNGHLVCPPCKEKMKAELDGGSATARVGMALAYGSGAAVLGAGAWYAIVKLTGYELGILAIVIGVMVGRAVRAGAQNRGGWAYQALAVGLTYFAMVAHYVPYVLEGTSQDGRSVNIVTVITAIVIAFGVPFLEGFKNVIGIFILGIGMYEAWKVNKRPALAINGPFKVSAKA